MTVKDGPTVTVVLMTYNHEKWIEQAIDGILLQEADFPIEVVILEDCSTDRTQEIIRDKIAAAARPGMFKPRFAERNENSNGTWLRTLREAASPYVINMDGDDYWTAPDKLSKQVRFMEEHPECALCFHNVRILNEKKPGGRAFNTNPPDQKDTSTLEEMLESNFVPTCSAMFAKRLVDPFPAWLDTVQWLDWSLCIHAASRGTVRYLSDVMAVYRIHGAGYWSGMSEIEQCERNAEFYGQINRVLDFRFDGVIRGHVEKIDATLARLRSASAT